MKFLLSLIKGLWQIINFIRNLVMNIVFLLFVLFLATLVSLTGSNHSKKTNSTLDQGALLIQFNGYLADNRDEQLGWSKALQQELSSEKEIRQLSTFDLVYAIYSAQNDERIRGLVLDLNTFYGADLPALEYLGKAIKDFKQQGKTVIALADNYDQQQYFLASFADQILINPIGQVVLEGLASQQLYYKSMLDKLQVTPHIFRVGTYKSAVEPFLRDDMSPEAKQNMQAWLQPMWQHYLQQIAQNRNVAVNKIFPEPATYLAELKNLSGNSTAYTKQRQLVTELATRKNMNDKLIELFGKNEDGEPKMLSFDHYLDELPDRLAEKSGEKIAVINVEGAIIDGESFDNEVGGDSVAKLLRQALDDEQVLSVILRVNSPGGSAFASEIIRQEVDNLQKSGKPVVVSMGAMAASGGYWISSTADYIVADKNTITGSIGIFAVLPTFDKAIKQIGVSADGVKTSAFSGQSAVTPLAKEVADLYQMEIEYGYDQFLDVVSRGRGLTKAEVDKVAQGQVWLGEQALKHKLVDELGDFDTALDKAIELVNKKRESANLFKLENIDVQWFTEQDDSLLGKIVRDMRKESRASLQNAILDLFGLSQFAKETQQVKQQLGLLNRFNDPKGQYLYCLNCGTIK